MRHACNNIEGRKYQRDSGGCSSSAFLYSTTAHTLGYNGNAEGLRELEPLSDTLPKLYIPKSVAE